MQLQLMENRLYTMDDRGRVIKSYECRRDFVPGYNDQWQPRAALPKGNYYCSAEIGDFGVPYGPFYIRTGDHRSRDIHGGGSGLTNPYADRQGWVPTLGCARMQNVDGIEVANWIIDNGNNMLLEVVD